MRKAKLFYEGNNFLLVKRREGGGLVVIQTSGYTMDRKAVTESWIFTQLRTVPHRDRSKLSDPFIMDHMLPCYERLNVTVIELYIKPGCKSLEKLAEEFAEYFERRCKPMILIGHSKGGLVMAAALERIGPQTTAILVAPTFGTVTGSEDAMINRLEENKGDGLLETLKTGFLKKVVKITSSRRPVDIEMYYTSKFVSTTKGMFSQLKYHYITNIIVRCPELATQKSMKTKLFIDFGKRLGLDPKKSDGIVEEENQAIEKEFINMSINIRAIHATALKTANNIIEEVLRKEEFSKA